MANVESIQEAMRLLVAERKTLRAHAARRDELESSRRELVRRRHELACALIARCMRCTDLDEA